jgi:hypothetical protein
VNARPVAPLGAIPSSSHVWCGARAVAVVGVVVQDRGSAPGRWGDVVDEIDSLAVATPQERRTVPRLPLYSETGREGTADVECFYVLLAQGS